MPGILRRILRRISLESACNKHSKETRISPATRARSGAHQCDEVVPSIAIARLEMTELQHLEITMKTYRVSDFEQGVIISSPQPQESVLGAALKKPSAENVGKAEHVGKGKTPADLIELIPSTSPIQQAKLFEAARHERRELKKHGGFANDEGRRSAAC
jgi:hypothetical protein